MRLLLHWSLLSLAAVQIAFGFTPAAASELLAFAAPPTLLTPPPFASFGGVRFVELLPVAVDQPRVITRVPMRVRCPEGYHYHRKRCHQIVYYQQFNYNLLRQAEVSFLPLVLLHQLDP